MRELGLGIDRVCGLLSPNKIAERLGRSVSQNSARRMDPLLKNLLRLLLVLCEVSLVLNMASCGGSTYSGFELIRRTVVFEIKREYEWGAVALTFISAMSLAGMAVLAAGKAPFRTLCAITALDMLLAVGAVGFYKINALFYPPSAMGIVHPRYGAYVAAALYIAAFATAVYGRACEMSRGIGTALWDYSHRQGPSAAEAPYVLGQAVLMLLMLYRVRSGWMETRIMLQVLLAREAVLLLLTLCRSRYAGPAAAAEVMGLVYMGYATVANGRRLGVLFLIAFLAVFGMAVRLLFFLNRRVEKEMVEMGRRRTEAAAGSRQAPPASRLHAPAGSRFCTGCGARLDSDSLFCPSCGKKRSLRPRAAHSEGKQEPAGQTR